MLAAGATIFFADFRLFLSMLAVSPMIFDFHAGFFSDASCLRYADATLTAD